MALALTLELASVTHTSLQALAEQAAGAPRADPGEDRIVPTSQTFFIGPKKDKQRYRYLHAGFTKNEKPVYRAGGKDGVAVKWLWWQGEFWQTNTGDVFATNLPAGRTFANPRQQGFRIRPTPHELALSKVVQHLLHRTFLRNCTAAATPRSVQQAVQHCFSGFTRVV